MNITAAEAEVIRLRARHHPWPESNPVPDQPRVWSPIGVESASGRAKCRLCGEPIEKGVECCSFMFDPYAVDREAGTWGRLAKAYIHDACADTQIGGS